MYIYIIYINVYINNIYTYICIYIIYTYIYIYYLGLLPPGHSQRWCVSSLKSISIFWPHSDARRVVSRYFKKIFIRECERSIFALYFGGTMSEHGACTNWWRPQAEQRSVWWEYIWRVWHTHKYIGCLLFLCIKH